MSPLVLPPEDFSEECGPPVQGLVENGELEFPLSLSLLFLEEYRPDLETLREILRSRHASMAETECEWRGCGEGADRSFLIGWGEHVVRVELKDGAMDPESVERCVASAHYADDLKDEARSHSGRATLTYVGGKSEPLDQLVALAAVTGSFAMGGNVSREQCAIVALNQEARTSIPVVELACEQGDLFRFLREMPLLFLYCGFMHYEMCGSEDVWMGTHGAHVLGLPDLAAQTEGVHESERYFWLFENVFRYLRKTSIWLKPGHTMQIGDGEFLRTRFPTEEESHLESDGILYVLELISPEEANWQEDATSDSPSLPVGETRKPEA